MIQRCSESQDESVALRAATWWLEHCQPQHFAVSRQLVEAVMVRTAEVDGKQTAVAFHQDPESAGKLEAERTARALAGYNVRFSTASGNKETRAKPVSAQAEADNVKLVRASAPLGQSMATRFPSFPSISQAQLLPPRHAKRS